jgi:SAM-dependent methyltransferase
MTPDFSSVTELPGRKVGRETLEVVCLRYFFASQFVDGRCLLEVGCGPGFGLGYLAKTATQVVAGDIDKDNLGWAIETHRGRENIRLLRLDGHELPFDDASFGVIISVATMCYLDLGRFLPECYRVLKKGGSLVFCMPNKHAAGFSPSKLSAQYYSNIELAALLTQHHFAPVLFGAFPVPRGIGRVSQRLIAAGGTLFSVLGFMRQREKIKEIVQRIIGYKVLTLARELNDKDLGTVTGIRMNRLNATILDTHHRMLYGAAQAVRE